VLLAETLEGYHNLIKLVSAGYTEGFYYKPRIDKALLAQHSKGIIGLSSCLKGEVASGIRTDQARKALDAAAQYRDILGPNNFFLEMQYQGIEDQRIVNIGLAPIAKELGLPLVVTNDVHYLRQSDQHPHDILLCIGTGKNVSDEKRLRYHGDQFFLKTGAEMARVFGDFPEALSNTMRIAERVDVTLPSGEAHLPDFAVPPGFTVETYFEHITREGLAERMPRLKAMEEAGTLRHPLAAYEERLAYENAMIKRMNYPAYFLNTWDFTYARGKGYSVGRAVVRCRQPRGAASRSPTSIRCTSICISSDFSTLNASASLTSISISASAAAAK
jgi:DNA polymerase-3 subunit alpha